MARIKVNERSIIDTYVNSNSNSASGRIEPNIRIGGYYKTLMRLNRRSSAKAAVSIKLHLTYTSAFTLGGVRVEANLHAYKIQEPWDNTVTNDGCPVWLQGKLLGVIPTSMTLGVDYEYDLTDWITVDELEDAGIMLIAYPTSAYDNATHLSAYSSRYISGAPFFEIEYADEPSLPTDLIPAAGANVEITGSAGRFSWKHNPSNVSNLPQKKYTIQLSGNGIDWTEISATSSNQYADVPVASIPSGNFYWRVQTIDTDDVPSDYSAQQYAYRGTAPAAPTIITSVFASSRPRLEWSTPYDQAGYRVQILLGATAIIDATVESEDRFFDVPVALANDTQYTVRVAVKDTSAHYSSWAEDAISTDYAVPAAPSFIASKKKDSVRLTITNPEGGEPVIRNDIYRLEGGVYVRVGSTTGAIYDDWSVGVGAQSYKVAAVGASGEAMSEAVGIEFDLETAFLTAVDDPYHPFEVLYNPLDKHAAEQELVLMEYAGRTKPVAEFGEITQRTVAVTFDSDDETEFNRLEELIHKKSVVLFRNSRTKLYGVYSNPTEQPEDFLGLAYNLSFLVSEIEHSEVV